MFSVLYVDDERDLLDLGKIFLEQSLDFRVEVALSAKDALSLMAIKSYDAIVSDFQMPEMDGIAFLKAVRVRFGDVPFILFSGRGREDVVIDAINNGADFYLQKGGDVRSQFAELSHKIKKAVELKREREAVHESEQRLANIINFLPVATFVIDTKGTVIAWNKAIEEMTGTPASSMLGKGDHEYAIPFYGERRPVLIDLILKPREEVEKRYQIVQWEGDVLIAETNLPRPLGKAKYLLVKASFLYNREGQVVGAIESIRDISKTKIAETALRESEEKFRTLVEQSMDGIIIMDFSGLLLFANPGIGKIIDCDQYSDLVGKCNVLDFVTPEFRERAEKDITGIAQGTDSFLAVYRITTFSHKEIWVECTGKKIHFEAKPATLLSLRDITSRKLIEDALKKAHEKLNILSSITRHDIANSLLALDSFSVLLGKKIKDNPEATDLLTRIQKTSRKIGDQIRFTKDYQDLGMNEPVWQNIATIAKMAAHDNLPEQISLDIFSGDYEIFSDPMLMLVFYNLFDNAKRHGETVTKITISFTESGNNGILVFSDNGAGVPEVLKDRIFDKGVGKNTGFGLFLAREILAITGLSIRETGTPGMGARFEIGVPLKRWRRGNGAMK